MTDHCSTDQAASLTTNPFEVEDGDHLKEECGVFGIIGDAEAAAHTALGLHALQHRGQEAAGIVSYDGRQFNSHRGMGHVSENFTGETVDRLKGPMAVGHTRYATTGDIILRNVQPLFAELESGGFAIAHNGNLTNAMTLRRELQKRGCLFQSTSDTEVVTHLIAISEQATVEDRLIDALRQIEGAYSFVCLTNHAVIGVRDPLGVRPLVLGKLDRAHILCSETCALDIIGAEYVRDIEPGEVVILSRDGIRSLKPFPKQHPRFCIFEYIYFARPDLDVEGSATSTKCARQSARSWRSKARSTATWWCRCRIPACRRRWVSRRRRASRSNTALSAITTSAAPSSSRPTRPGIWA